jgi:hypothetical protein
MQTPSNESYTSVEISFPLNSSSTGISLYKNHKLVCNHPLIPLVCIAAAPINHHLETTMDTIAQARAVLQTLATALDHPDTEISEEQIRDTVAAAVALLGG